MLFLLLAQATLPPANALPPPGTEEAAVMAPITSALAAIKAKDGAALLAQTYPGGSATSVGDGKVARQSWADFAARLKPGGPNVEETMSDPAIEVDGDIAMVWARYTFRVAGEAQHCGVDHFDLIRSDGRWRILNITWSTRTTGCGR